MSCDIKFDTKELETKLNRSVENIDKKIELVFLYNQAWAATWMKINAPWTDDTGAARSGLFALASSSGGTHEMLLSYSVNYGIWLEVANSGRFQILGPAIRYVSQKIMSDLEYIINDKPPTASGTPTRTIPPQARKVVRKGTSNKSGSRRSRKAYGQRRSA